MRSKWHGRTRQQPQAAAELNESGKTVILITHEPDIAAHAKLVVYVRDGLIWRDEKIVQTRAHPEKPVEDSEMAIAFPFTIAPSTESVEELELAEVAR